MAQTSNLWGPASNKSGTPTSREAIAAALLSYLETKLAPAIDGGKFQVVTRKPMNWDSIAGISQMPALIQQENTERAVLHDPGAPAKITLQYDLFFVLSIPKMVEPLGKETFIPMTPLNNLLDALDVLLLPDDRTRGKFTLGGLVEHCWIEGVTKKDDGQSVQGKGIAMVPINVLVSRV